MKKTSRIRASKPEYPRPRVLQLSSETLVLLSAGSAPAVSCPSGVTEETQQASADAC